MEQIGKHKKLLTLVVITIATLSASCGPQQKYAGEGAITDIKAETWLTIDEPTLGFKSKFPGKWKTPPVETMETENGLAYVYIFDYWHVAFQYGITVVKFPHGVADMSDPDTVLDFAVNSLAEEQNGTVAFQENVNMGGYPARRAMISLPDSYLKQARVNTMIILRNQLVYRITTAGVGNHEFIEHFMDSFELTPVIVQFNP